MTTAARPEIPTISLAELREALSLYPDHYRVSFSGLDFYRVKERAPALIQIEFSQGVHRTAEGRVVVEFPE